jgi:NAD+ synthase
MSSNIDRQIERLLGFHMEAEVARIVTAMRDILGSQLRKRGLVVGISGGIDSSVCTALAVRAVGKGKVFGLLMPERDSSSGSVTKGRMVAELCGIEHTLEDIAPALEAIGCYRWRDEAMRSAVPDYQPDWKSKITISGGTEGQVNFFRLVVEDPAGRQIESRLALKAYLQIVAATSFKQRVRKMLEYFHADRLNYAVIGTPNRLEYDQGFFVKNGDGSADIKPIAHLYKSQVYMLARHLGLPEVICNAVPSTDTYSLTQGQDEFYFALPYKEMDLALLHYNRQLPAEALAQVLGMTAAQAQLIYQDIEAKRRTTAPLHWPAITVEKVVGPQTTPAPTLEQAI